jgi:hypothetical protein
MRQSSATSNLAQKECAYVETDDKNVVQKKMRSYMQFWKKRKKKGGKKGVL